VQVSTPVRKISPAEAENPDRVKVVFSKSGRAIYFSRAPIPFRRDGRPDTYFGHIGLYAFRMTALERFVALDPSALETTEKLEQLRLLENDIPIHIVVTEHQSLGVDRPEDLETVVQMMETTKRA
jgi:3-deoxy-manno-octulosonate cytidylyltransferase (CMP-KDO synthetase)